MRQFVFFVALATLIGFGTACTFQSVTQKTGKVVVLADGPRVASKLAEKKALASTGDRTQRNVSSIAGRSLGRMLSASDINNLSYTVTNVNNPSDTDTGSISLYYLSVDLYLTPGETYEISVDVDIKPSAEGYNLGVRRYGDSATFTVDPTYDTYVDLTVHPTQALVFDPASVASGTPNQINYFNPGDATPTATPIDFLTGTVTPGPADKLFYGPDAKLYYFNKAANAVYRWTDIGAPMSSSSKVIDGAVDLHVGYTVDLYAACADPTYQDMVWVLGYDTLDATWNYYQMDLSGGSPSIRQQSGDLTPDLLDGEVSATLVPTGIAVDTTYEDVYITYYNFGGTDVHSGLLQYWKGNLYVAYPSSNSPSQGSTDPDQVPAVFSDSIYTDVAWDQGRAWVLKSPNTSLAGPATDSGTADLLIMDDLLDTSVYTQPNLQQTYSGATFSPETATTLEQPNRFAGPTQGTRVFVSQQDFVGGGTFGLSAIDLSDDSVTTY